MSRSEHQKEVSPLIRGGIFAQSVRRSKAKQEPTSKEMINDYAALLKDLLLAFTKVVDKAYPTADFLSNLAGSKIGLNTTLSSILTIMFNLSQMSMPSEVVSNYQQTLKTYLKDIQHNTPEQYTELLNIIKTYQSIAGAIKGQEQIQAELTRLNALDLAAKTIDRRLQKDWVQPCVQKTVASLTAQVAKTMRASERLQSPELAGRNNSLASLSRLVAAEPKTRKQTQHNEELPKYAENQFLGYQSATA